MKNLGFIIIVIFVFISCNEEDPIAEQLENDIELIKEYLKQNNLLAESTSSGVYYIIEEKGTGNSPDINSIVEVNYKGSLLNGNVFGEGTVKDKPLYSYIKGWQVGIPKFSEGGYGIIIIPSGLGYGSVEKTSIPANSVLIFEIQLISVAN